LIANTNNKNDFSTTRNHYICLLGNASSGKTSMSNLMIQSLPVLTGNQKSIEELIEKSNKLMEVFGGAQVTDDQRSCRFGKYTIVGFDSNAKIREIRITTHLFEKLRIVNRPSDESNLVVFYQLLAGALEAERPMLGLLPIEEYRYLAGGAKAQVTPEDLDDTRDWMSHLGFTLNEIDSIFEIVSSILLIGNVSFVPHMDGVSISNMEGKLFSSYFSKMSSVFIAACFFLVVEKISDLLGIFSKDFVDALVNKQVVVHVGEEFKMKFDIAQAQEARDGVAKNLYEKLWLAVVNLINQNLTRRISNQRIEGSRKDGYHYHIGILDTLGFAHLEVSLSLPPIKFDKFDKLSLPL